MNGIPTPAAGPSPGESAGLLAESATTVGRLAVHGCSSLVILNLEGVQALSAELLRFLAQALREGRDVEMLNPTRAVQEELRRARLETCVLIRGATEHPYDSSGHDL